ncbi:hypothetical protein JWJ88_12555 (plasmid) [Paracoccus methylovorus]|uniref:Uncharacterized protein n=1 Tax=Paracoccus methylovorus TaxID=2812658 RepID=A0ABX7JJZ7_9RHOB|nr:MULTISPECIES: hypothetical protein [Paracoccus]QRZ14315.1 hypothetical protein JWJ88_12555 [Paracoccus methylovorus]
MADSTGRRNIFDHKEYACVIPAQAARITISDFGNRITAIGGFIHRSRKPPLTEANKEQSNATSNAWH